MKGLDIICGKCWVSGINGIYHTNHKTNEMLNTQGDISWDNRERAAQMHYICGIQLDCEPDDNTIKEVAWTKDVQIIGKQQLHHMDHRVLAKTFMV